MEMGAGDYVADESGGRLTPFGLMPRLAVFAWLAFLTQDFRYGRELVLYDADAAQGSLAQATWSRIGISAGASGARAGNCP